MGKRDRLWKKLWVLALCGVMAMEPAVACAEEPAEAMNAADAQADVSMELPEEVENDIVEEMDEAVAEIPSEAGTESGKTDAEASDIDETAETDTEGSSTGEAVAPYDRIWSGGRIGDGGGAVAVCGARLRMNLAEPAGQM